ncbi:putative metal-binding protein [Leptolyngbyaceae cyanobacterium JSC-12]|nr:putative metal-binding protein [Leptolyngbyaceae cyanobacterium JSC-12]
MPSGQTHDRITLWSLPLVAGVTFERTQNASLTLIVSGGYLFSGLMFGPDLDIHSRQYRRWGVLRWIWLPYRRSMRHRAFLSHGPIVGTVVRIVYLLGWVGACLAVIGLVSAIAYQLTGEFETWTQFFQQYWLLATESIGRSLRQHYSEWLALLIGLELGALSHSLSDWISSRYKRLSPRKPGKSAVSLATTKRTSPSPRPVASQPSTVELPPLPPAQPSDSKLPPLR